MAMETKIEAKRLFLIGAAKCGTTTVDQMLRSHPEIYMSPLKEPNYYSTDIDPVRFNPTYRAQVLHDLDAYFANRPLQPLHLDFVRDERYWELFSEARNEKWIGESSTSYLPSSVAPEKIAEEHPGARIIVCVRNPYERLVSHVKMALQGGNITEISDEVVQADYERSDRGWGVSEMFLELGLYGEQLERWLKHFDRRQIHILTFEELIEDQQKVWSDLCAFLNVSIFAQKSDFHANAGGVPRFPKLNAMLKGSKRVMRIIDRMPENWVKALKSQWQDGKAEIQLDEKKWKAFYRRDIERVETILGRSLDQWK